METTCIKFYLEVPGFPNTLISEDGSVINSRGGFKPLKLELGKRGYLIIRRFYGGKRFHTPVHRQVGILFKDNPENLKVLNHIDGNKLNNHKDNLEWCTQAYNVQHAYDTGLRKKGGDTACSKLKWEDVNWIRSQVGLTITYMARKFGVERATIRNVINNKTWRVPT